MNTKWLNWKVYLINAPSEYAKKVSNTIATNRRAKSAYVINIEVISDAHYLDF